MLITIFRNRSKKHRMTWYYISLLDLVLKLLISIFSTQMRRANLKKQYQLVNSAIYTILLSNSVGNNYVLLILWREEPPRLWSSSRPSRDQKHADQPRRSWEEEGKGFTAILGGNFIDGWFQRSYLNEEAPLASEETADRIIRGWKLDHHHQLWRLINGWYTWNIRKRS